MSPVSRAPAYVPTLTEIVHTESARKSLYMNVIDEKPATTELQELMAQRVLLHIDLVLKKRLHEATEQLIREHAKAFLPQLLDEIALTVRELVCQAFEREMSTNPMQTDSHKPDPF